jgi:hypothetical protein
MPHANASTTSAFLGVAVIQGIVLTIGWMMYSPRFGWIDWLITGSGPIFFAIAFASRWWPLPSAILATSIYAAFLGFQACLSIDLLLTGWIIKGPIVLFLLVGLFTAARRGSDDFDDS